MKIRKLSQKIILSYILFACLNTLVIVAVGGTLYRNNIIDQYNETGYQLARSIRSTIMDEEIKIFARTARGVYLGESSLQDASFLTSEIRFQRMCAAADSMREQFGAANIYYIGMLTDDLDAYLGDPDHLRSPAFSIIDSYAGDDGPQGFGAEADFAPQVLKIMRGALETGQEPGQRIIVKSKYGYFIHSFVPLVSEDGSEAIGVGVVFYMQTLITKILQFVVASFFASLFVTGVFMLLYLRYQLRAVINPIRLVSSEAVSFASEQLNAEASEGMVLSDRLKEIQTGDELQLLAESIYALEDGIRGFAGDLKRVTAEKERIGAELDLATQIQSDVLPKIFPAFPHRHEFDIYASMTPAKEVGGDFYDFFLTDEDHLALVIADVSGKGVPAALFMMIAKALIKTTAQAGASPSETLAQVNAQLAEGNDSMLFVTVWMAIIEISTGKGVAVNAAHEHPVIRRAGGRYELVEYEHSIAIGIMDGMPFEEHEFQLQRGDSLFVYTDGVAEACDSHDRRFETDRLLSALNHDPAASPLGALTQVKKAIDEFVDGEEQFDDITMLGLQWKG